jgi:hypothetical protein
MPDVNPPPPSERSDAEMPGTAKPDATLLQVIGAVFWSFFGVRKGRHMQQDTVTIKPLHVVIVGVLSGLAFVLALLALVTFITRSAG